MIRWLTPPLLAVVGALWLVGALLNLLAGLQDVAFAAAWAGIMSILASFTTAASLRWAAYVHEYLEGRPR